jgi:hypothetical protein
VNVCKETASLLFLLTAWVILRSDLLEPVSFLLVCNHRLRLLFHWSMLELSLHSDLVAAEPELGLLLLPAGQILSQLLWLPRIPAHH